MGNASDDTTSAPSPATAGASAVAAPPSAPSPTAASLTLDDRGRPFKLMSPVELGKAMHEANATGKADVFAALMQAYSARVPASKWGQVLSRQLVTRVLSVMLVGGLLVLVPTALFPMPSWTGYLFMPLLVLGMLWAFNAPLTAEDLQGYRKAMASRDLCRGCGYDMQRLTPADDGCAVCPECGCAWRLTLQGRALEQVEVVRAVHPGRLDWWNFNSRGMVTDAAGVAQPCVSLASLNNPAITALARRYAVRTRIKCILAIIALVILSALLVWSSAHKVIQPALTIDWFTSLLMVLSVVYMVVQLPLLLLNLRTESAIFAPATALAAIQHNRCPACSANLNEPATDPADATSASARPAHQRSCTTCSAVWDTKTKPKRVGWV